ncbi:MAG: response regulator [Thermodesulfobacteriota bacterium]
MAREILIADSDKANQKEFQKIFETTDYHLIFSESGEDALLRTKLFKPDMIIASAGGLREMGGVEFCGAIKKEPDFKDIPFILVSNVYEEISEKDRQRVRADGVISIPLNEDEVLNLVDHLMEEVGKREEMVSGKSEFVLDEVGEGEEEIIELTDVVEEPEPKMSIDDLVASQKEEPLGEIGSLDSWEKLEFEEKPAKPESVLRREKEMGETDLQLRDEKSVKESSPEDELFEKIELEEILEKVEQLKPSLEKEWPAQGEVRNINETAFQTQEPDEKWNINETASKTEEPDEKRFDLSEFEAALQREVEAAPSEQELAPLSEPSLGTAAGPAFSEFFEEPKKEIPEAAAPIEVPAEEEELKELPEEEFPDELLEEILGEDEISVIGKPEEVKPEEMKPEEERPKEVRAETIKADRLEEFERGMLEGEEASLVRRVDRPTEEVTSLSEVVDKHLEEVLAKGVQEMVGDFITKILPEMTQNIIGLTAERIEKMVKEIVPDLAEKAIQEEIKRLQKGEKE